MTSARAARVAMSWPQYLRGECRLDGRIVFLRPLEASLLSALLVADPNGLSWADLIEAMWPDPDTQPIDAEGVITTMVSRMSAKGVPFERQPIFGSGWRIAAEARAHAPPSCRKPAACQWAGMRRKRPGSDLCVECFNKRMRQRQRLTELTPKMVEMWRFLERHPGATNRQMATHFRVHWTSVRQRLDALIAKGLAERVVKPGGKNGKVYARRPGKPEKLAELAQIEAALGVKRTSLPVRVIRVDPRSVEVLECIVAEPGCTSTELLQRLGLERCTVNTRVARLVRRGVVEKVGTPYRPMRFLPTKDGVVALEHARAELSLRSSRK